MKFKQEKAFKPIEITLENYEEASAFFGLIDLIDGYLSHANAKFKQDMINKEMKNVIIAISNSRTENIVL